MSISAKDRERFTRITTYVTTNLREKMGIGTLAEKTVHVIFKNFYSEDTDTHEIPVEGSIADIYYDGKIIEIQNGNFNKMRVKLDRFLPDYEVTIVYPIPASKWLIWIDSETGEQSKRHKSPKKGNAYEAFPELYKIKSYLKNSNLKFRFVLFDVLEMRLLDGWSKDKKKGSNRYDRIPVELVDEVCIDRIEDYLQFIPIQLEDGFVSAEFAKAAHIHISLARFALNILDYVGAVERVGKKGNSIMYKVKTEE